jgi:hypothetical protein
MSNEKLMALVARAEAEERERAAQQAAEEAAAEAALQKQGEAWLAQGLALLEGIAGPDEVEVVDLGGQFIKLKAAPAVWRGLADFIFRYRVGERWYAHDTTKNTVYIDSPDGWSGPHEMAFLVGLNRRYRKMAENVIANRVWALEGDASGDSAGAKALYDELIALAPERAAEWNALWLAWQVREAARQAAKTERAERFGRYLEALRAWATERAEVVAHNRAVVEALQAEFDQSFTRWTLEQRLRDGEGEVYVERVIVADAHPNERDYWPVFEDGQVVLRRLFGLVSQSTAVTELLSEAGRGPWRRSFYVSAADGRRLDVLPWHAEDAQRRLAAELRPLPEEPAIETFDPDDSEFVYGLTVEERRAISEIEGTYREAEVPF